MLPEGIAFTPTRWDDVPVEEHKGESGAAYWKIAQFGTTRVRMVEYSAGYLADHWCARGHVLLVLEGELETELDDGRTIVLGAGMSYTVSTGARSHRSRSRDGARLFIVD